MADYIQDELGAEISKRINDHSRQTQTFVDNCFTFDKMYRCVPEDRRNTQDGENRTFANTFVPEFFQDVETVVSAIDALIFTEQPWLTTSPDELSDSEQEKAENTQALLEKQVNGTAWNPRLRTKMLPAIRSFVINGTCVGKVPWEYRTRKAADGLNFIDKVMKDGPGFKNIPLWRFHFDPWAANIEDALWVAEKFRTSVKEAQGLISRAKGMSGAVVTEVDDEFWKASPNVNGSDNTGTSVGDSIRQGRGYANEGDKRPEVIEYWGENPDDKNSPVDWRIVTINGKVVVKMPNPYSHGLKPYVKGCFINLDESFYGLGLGAILKLPQAELNDFRNLMRDILNLTLNHPWQRAGGLSSSKHSKERMKVKPNMTLDSVKDGIFTPVPVNVGAIQPGMMMEEKVVNGMRSESAASAIQQGVPTDVSAREISAMGNASDRRLLSLATVFVDGALRPVLWMWHELNKQFKVKPEMVTVQSPDGTSMSRNVAGMRVEKDTVTGMETVVSDLLDQPDINVILSVDADGRKGMIRRISAAFDNLLTANRELKDRVSIDFPPIIKEMVRLMGIRPMNIVTRVPPMAPPMPGMEQAGAPPLQAPGEALPPEIPPMPTGAVSEGLTPVPDLPPGTPVGQVG